jgi:lipoprotein Spr
VQFVVKIAIGLFLISSVSMGQLDSNRVDSLILHQLIQTTQPVSASEQDSVVVNAPPDLDLISFFTNKGIGFDSLCSTIELYREVYTWLGVRYRYAGLTKKGVDCAGFVKNICNTVYGCNLSGSARDHFKKCIPIEREDLEEGDLVFFKINQSQISHVGLYLGNNKFVHAAVHGGVMINDLSEKYYNKYYYISGRLVNAPNKKKW